MRNFRLIAVIFISFFCLDNHCHAQLDTASPLPPRYNSNKKLIEFGWGNPTVPFLLENMNSLSQRPFQGLVFKPYWPEYSKGFPQSIFYPVSISESYMKFDSLAMIQWGNTLTDNFMKFWVAGFVYAGWFDDAQWTVVDTNLRRISKAVQVSGAKGIFFDTEHYDSNIWRYNTTLYPTQSLAEVQAKVRQRGYQFMKALATHKTDIKILTTGLWMFPSWESGGKFENIQSSGYCLLKSFADGMLDAAVGEVKIIDGNEISYYWLNTINWHYQSNVYNLVSDARGFVDPALKSKNDQFKQVGQSIYYTKFKPVLKTVNQRRLEHNVYNSLLLSDEYVWFYSEEGDSWWTEPFPAGADSAIRSGYNKLMQGQPLGFTISKDTVVNYSTDLQIISPAQNQVFTVGDTIVFKTQSESTVNNITYFSGFKNLPNIAATPAVYKSIATTPGTYLVYAHSNSFLKLSNPVTYHVKLVSSVEENSEKHVLKTYPNPATTTVHFLLKELQADKITIKIYSISGENIASIYSAGMNDITFDTAPLSNGIYFYEIALENNGTFKTLPMEMIVVVH